MKGFPMHDTSALKQSPLMQSRCLDDFGRGSCKVSIKDKFRNKFKKVKNKINKTFSKKSNKKSNKKINKLEKLNNKNTNVSRDPMRGSAKEENNKVLFGKIEGNLDYHVYKN